MPVSTRVSYLYRTMYSIPADSIDIYMYAHIPLAIKVVIDLRYLLKAFSANFACYKIIFRYTRISYRELRQHS